MELGSGICRDIFFVTNINEGWSWKKNSVQKINAWQARVLATTYFTHGLIDRALPPRLPPDKLSHYIF